MKSSRRDVVVAALFSLALVAGCGQGLSLNVTAVPDPAVPGSDVKYTVTMRNDSPCETVADVNDAAEFPIAVIFGFQPDDEFGGSGEQICRVLQSCTDVDCTRTILGPAFELMSDMASGAIPVPGRSAPGRDGAALAGIPDGTCEFDSAIGGVLGFCAFGQLAPGQSQTLMATIEAPDIGNPAPVLFALAFAGASGSDCSPGIDLGGDDWILGGCFPLVDDVAPAPALSATALASLIAVLLFAGAWALRLRRIRD